jgi:hypothetical protein
MKRPPARVLLALLLASLVAVVAAVGLSGPASDAPASRLLHRGAGRPTVAVTTPWLLAMARQLSLGRITLRLVSAHELRTDVKGVGIILSAGDGSDPWVADTGASALSVLDGAPLLLGVDGRQLSDQHPRAPERPGSALSAAPAAVMPGALAAPANAVYALARVAFGLSTVDPGGRLARTRAREALQGGLWAQARALARCRMLPGVKSRGAQLYLLRTLPGPAGPRSTRRAPAPALLPGATERRQAATALFGDCGRRAT